ncbi:MAG: tRNA glutamyl-Q(34) synthetase GluQRS [Alphaproteobacteria bacterium]|nr:tRNA glutamyl-Q(34) synthetase GluQRS [Alphaproteobacteria bacterium]
MVTTVTRFAPSPTGYLHLGHAFAALYAADLAFESGGRFLVRIEDTDRTRARPEYEAAIFEDLGWLGLTWEAPVRRQSEHFGDYAKALDALKALGCAYPCFCTRKEIEAEFAASVNAPHGPDGPIYPGTCRALSKAEREQRLAHGDKHAWRLDVAKAVVMVGARLSFEELGNGANGERGTIAVNTDLFGDFVLARKDAPSSYHLAVVVDDALQGVTLVTRGNDLFAAVHVHRLLQELLKLPVPAYSHHRLILDASGKRLAKRDQATTLKHLRADGWTSARVREALGLTSR